LLPTLPRLNRAILDQIIALSREALLVADLRRPGFPILYANPAFETLAGVDNGAAVGRDWSFFLNTEIDSQKIEALSQRVLERVECENAVLHAAADKTQFSLTLNPLPGRQSRSRYLLVQVHPAPAALPLDQPDADRSDDSPRGRDLSVTSGRRDADSGLLSYEYFLQLCARDFALCSRQRREVAMITFSIGQFDVYRQTFGDKAAKSCLRMVGGRIAGALRRAGDLCARLGEDSFVALITGHDPDQAAQFADQIATEVRQLALHHPRASGERYVTCQVGVNVAVPDASDTPECFVSAARNDDGEAALQARSQQPAV
jgi:diguanylate cyclase (GGDEF)-like protein